MSLQIEFSLNESSPIEFILLAGYIRHRFSHLTKFFSSSQQKLQIKGLQEWPRHLHLLTLVLDNQNPKCKPVCQPLDCICVPDSEYNIVHRLNARHALITQTVTPRLFHPKVMGHLDVRLVGHFKRLKIADLTAGTAKWLLKLSKKLENPGGIEPEWSVTI